jgi:hypothetical protein
VAGDLAQLVVERGGSRGAVTCLGPGASPRLTRPHGASERRVSRGARGRAARRARWRGGPV